MNKPIALPNIVLGKTIGTVVSGITHECGRILFEAEMSMEKRGLHGHEFSARHAGLVENVDVEACARREVEQLALIRPEPRLLVVQPFDASTVRDIERH